jgi:uncharacterized membrane protein YccC
LLLRLTETAVGAGVAIAVVLLVLPVPTSAAGRAAQAAFLRQLAHLLADVRDRLGAPGRHSDLLYDARLLDAKLHQLALVNRPAAGPMLVGLSRRSAAATVAGWTAVAYRARSLAAAVAATEPGTHAELAEQCELLRARCCGEHGVITAEPRREASGAVERRFDELVAALDEVLPQPGPQPAHPTVRT